MVNQGNPGHRRRQVGSHQAGAVTDTRAACLAVVKDLDLVKNSEGGRELKAIYQSASFSFGVFQKNIVKKRKEQSPILVHSSVIFHFF